MKHCKMRSIFLFKTEFCCIIYKI